MVPSTPFREGALPASPFEETCARLRRQLVQSVRRVCPGWLANQAEDIVQVAMIRVFEILRRSEGNLILNSSYLSKVAFSATVDEIRRLRSRKEVPLEEQAVESVAGVVRLDPERVGAGQEIGRAVRHCLCTLAEPRRLAVALHLQGHSVPEIGPLLGWNNKRAENLVYRGLADLRRCLASKGFKP